MTKTNLHTFDLQNKSNKQQIFQDILASTSIQNLSLTPSTKKKDKTYVQIVFYTHLTFEMFPPGIFNIPW